MNKKIIGLFFTFACIFTCESAHALLWDLSPGDVIYYTRTPNGGTGWQVTLTVAGIDENIEINGHTYLHMYQSNYDSEAETEDFYFYINDTQLWTSGGSTEDLLFDTSKLTGESWTREDGSTVTMRGFDNTIGAYFVEINKENTPSWYEYLVPQLGVVMEVDYNVGQNAPYVMKRDGWNPAPVPEPSTFLLFGTSLAGLAAVGRRKKAN